MVLDEKGVVDDMHPTPPITCIIVFWGIWRQTPTDRKRTCVYRACSHELLQSHYIALFIFRLYIISLVHVICWLNQWANQLRPTSILFVSIYIYRMNPQNPILCSHCYCRFDPQYLASTQDGHPFWTCVPCRDKWILKRTVSIRLMNILHTFIDEAGTRVAGLGTSTRSQTKTCRNEEGEVNPPLRGTNNALHLHPPLHYRCFYPLHPDPLLHHHKHLHFNKIMIIPKIHIKHLLIL